MNQLLFQRSWLFRLCRAFWWFFVFPCCFFYCLIAVVVAMFRYFGRCCCSCSFSSLRIVLCHFVQLSGWCFFGLGHFRCCHQEHRNSLRDCGMCCQPSLQMRTPGGVFLLLGEGLLEHQHSTCLVAIVCHQIFSDAGLSQSPWFHHGRSKQPYL